MIYITNNIEKLSKILDIKNFDVIDNQTHFNEIAFNHDEIIEYLFNDEKTIIVPTSMYKLVDTYNEKNVQINQYSILDKVINGKRIANNILKNIKIELDSYKEELKKNKLVIVQVGNLYASNIYIKNKLNIALKLGIKAELKNFNNTITQQELIDEIIKLNNDETVCSILVQSPLPNHINQDEISNIINPKKDVDCFNPYNVGSMFINFNSSVKPCTPEACLRIMQLYDINLESKNVVVIGRSNIVGKPLSIMCLQKNATVTTCHSKTNKLWEITRQADILISAVGKPKFINSEYIKNNAICIDVGISRIDGKICGDFDFDSIYDKVKLTTPVPNGVGPITIAILFENFLKLFKLKLEI